MEGPCYTGAQGLLGSAPAGQRVKEAHLYHWDTNRDLLEGNVRILTRECVYEAPDNC